MKLAYFTIIKNEWTYCWYEEHTNNIFLQYITHLIISRILTKRHCLKYEKVASIFYTVDPMAGEISRTHDVRKIKCKPLQCY